MFNAKSINFRLAREVGRLYQESVINRLLGGIRIGGKRLNDGVDALQINAVGMFFYNQRAILFGCGTLFLLVLTTLVVILPSTPEAIISVEILAVFWIVDVIATLSLHPQLRHALNLWSKSPLASHLPPLFDRYFILDYLLLLSLIVAGRLFHIKFDAFAYLLFANVVLYGAYIRHSYLRVIVFLSSLGIVPVVMISSSNAAFSSPIWFHMTLYLTPLIGALIVTMIFVTFASWLRTFEHQVSQQRLKILAEAQYFLSEPSAWRTATTKSITEPHSEDRFDNRILRVFQYLCSLGNPFWYRSACLWFLQMHQDHGTIVVRGPSHNLLDKNLREAIVLSSNLLSHDVLITLRSTANGDASPSLGILNLDQCPTGPSACLPLRVAEGRQIGALTIWGEEMGPGVNYQEDVFLRSLGSMISNAMERSNAQHKALAQAEMDDLFKCENLQHVFHKAAKILKNYLEAQGCMIVFRPNPADPNMHIMATEGFSNVIFRRNLYEVGKGQTGLCAQLGRSIRWDDVARHRDRFDSELLDGLEVAHGKPIRSWLAIPIGSKSKNYGVIKVVNRSSWFSWFTTEDEELGVSLALRLQVIIEKFLYIEMMANATQEAISQTEEAQRLFEKASIAQKEAEEIAKRRQEDLMIITHQLYGPLSSIIGGITNLKRGHLSPYVEQRLDYVRALVEDCYTLCYGISTTFAVSGGSRVSFELTDIDVPQELRKFCNHLQEINSREDLNLSFRSEPNFPRLWMDRDLFTGVFYNLIHNAMKYSDPFSEVSLICGFERDVPVIKMKSVGEPIRPNEASKIFEKFQRGQSTRGKGSHGTGLGLWVARELMRAAGGDLTVELTTANPRLSIFIVHLPTR